MRTPRRLLIVSGVSGTEIGRVLSFLSKSLGVATAKYEDYVEEVFRAPIYHVAELLLAGYQRAAEKLNKAWDNMIGSLDGKEEAIIGAHLVYYRRGNAILSPLITKLEKLAASGTSIAMVDYVDDYYHALYRLAERVRQGRTPEVTGFQVLDPLGMLNWRSIHNSVTQLLAQAGVRAVVYASKHSAEGHRRLAAMLLGRRTEEGRVYESAYISHPISLARKKAFDQGARLDELPEVRDIEGFKRLLEERCSHLVVYSPTAIDELITSRDGGLATRIEKGMRWPHPENGLHEYPYPVDLASELFNSTLYPVEKTTANKGYLEILRDHIGSSIERRDLSYVAQADYVIAYRPTLYGAQHMGVETEIKTATALTKPVYSIVPPEERIITYKLFRFEYPLASPEELLSVLHC